MLAAARMDIFVFIISIGAIMSFIMRSREKRSNSRTVRLALLVYRDRTGVSLLNDGFMIDEFN